MKASAARYAAQLGRKTVDAMCMRLACETRQLMQAPVRTVAVEAGRVHNARTIAWPLGPTVRVPLTSVAEHRTDVLLRAPSAAAGGGSWGSGAATDAADAAMAAAAVAGAPGFAVAAGLPPSGARPLVAQFKLKAGGGGSGGARGAAAQGGATFVD